MNPGAAPMATNGEGAVTLVITRRVRAGCESAYEAWLQDFQAAGRGIPGYLGVTTQRPAAGGPRDYVSVLRFDSVDHLREFERSDLRARYMQEVGPLVEADAVWQQLTGLEFWFTPPPGTVVPQPSRPRMVALMIVVVFSLVLGLGSIVNAGFARLPLATPYPLRLLLTIVIEVLLMTYWLMPLLTRRLAFWIYPRRMAAPG